ncbi:hypothetical protein NECAME_06745 [Necator americanus]|uniref:Uncharacterized protein n=1 Tax=Necator americanus TaxID=51031 RepID=W2TRM5_NECAM|nr:hypothetical protein NECAME_06745 [Necator americanus]ETN84715.1 hypothetical protein NECAME_06745 [Necator americanus]
MDFSGLEKQMLRPIRIICRHGSNSTRVPVTLLVPTAAVSMPTARRFRLQETQQHPVHCGGRQLDPGLNERLSRTDKPHPRKTLSLCTYDLILMLLAPVEYLLRCEKSRKQ